MEQKNIRKIQNAWAMYDWANSAFVTTIMAAVLPVYYASVAGPTCPGILPRFTGLTPPPSPC